MSKRYPLYKNPISYVGWYIIVSAFAIGVVLVAADMLFFRGTPYNAVVTYLIIPAVMTLGGIIAVLGILWEWWERRRRGVEHHLPVLDMNRRPIQRKLLIALLALTLFFSVSAVATYRGFIFTESTQFCGAVCHSVMHPEYTAYQHSPHARVACVECHIGSGADWYVRSKLSGLRQVYRTVTDSFTLPIEVPVKNLRPARETCEHCHWPEKFTGNIEHVLWHFWNDEENTPSKYNMLLKVGGTRRETDKAVGIHWHVSPRDTVRYWPKDRERLDIPWIEVEYSDGSKKVFRTDEAPEGRPPENEIRTMDCIDCHNRPSHVYQPPYTTVNSALAAGAIDRHLPSIKETAVNLLEGKYKTTEEALRKIEETLVETYAHESSEEITSGSVEQAVVTLKEIYSRSYFPEAGVNWKIYPNHIGHRNFPGCFRCHTEEHESEEGDIIGNDCNLCHEFVFQAHGEAAYGPVTYKSQPFQHPGEDMEDIWQGSLCTDCHAVE